LQKQSANYYLCHDFENKRHYITEREVERGGRERDREREGQRERGGDIECEIDPEYCIQLSHNSNHLLMDSV